MKNQWVFFRNFAFYNLQFSFFNVILLFFSKAKLIRLFLGRNRAKSSPLNHSGQAGIAIKDFNKFLFPQNLLDNMPKRETFYPLTSYEPFASMHLNF